MGHHLEKEIVVNNRSTTFGKPFHYNLTHIMAVMTNKGGIYFKFSKGTIINMDVTDFLKEVVIIQRVYTFQEIFDCSAQCQDAQNVLFRNFVIKAIWSCCLL